MIAEAVTNKADGVWQRMQKDGITNPQDHHLFKDGSVAYFVARADVLVDNLTDNLLSDCLHETRISDTRSIDGFLAPPSPSCLNAFPKLLWF